MRRILYVVAGLLCGLAVAIPAWAQYPADLAGDTWTGAATVNLVSTESVNADPWGIPDVLGGQYWVGGAVSDGQLLVLSVGMSAARSCETPGYYVPGQEENCCASAWNPSTRWPDVALEWDSEMGAYAHLATAADGSMSFEAVTYHADTGEATYSQGWFERDGIEWVYSPNHSLYRYEIVEGNPPPCEREGGARHVPSK